MGMAQINAQTAEALRMFMSQLQIWLLVSNDDDRTAVTEAFAQKPASLPVQVFSLTDIASALQNMG